MIRGPVEVTLQHHRIACVCNSSLHSNGISVTQFCFLWCEFKAKALFRMHLCITYVCVFSSFVVVPFSNSNNNHAYLQRLRKVFYVMSDTTWAFYFKLKCYNEWARALNSHQMSPEQWLLSINYYLISFRRWSIFIITNQMISFRQRFFFPLLELRSSIGRLNK